MVAEQVAATAALWLVNQLRKDADNAAWSRLKALVWGKPLTQALERVTSEALVRTARSELRAQPLDDEMVDPVVMVLWQHWPKTSVNDAAGESVVARVAELAGAAMAQATKPVEGLGPERDGTSSWSEMARDYELDMDTGTFGIVFGSEWAQALVEAARTNGEMLGPLANELYAELVLDRIDETREEIVSKMSSLATAAQVDQLQVDLNARLTTPLGELVRASRDTEYAKLRLKAPVAELNCELPPEPWRHRLRGSDDARGATTVRA